MSEAIVQVSGLTRSFGPRNVLDNLDLTLERGSVFGLVGMNGVGKTTLIRLLLGLIGPDSGACRVMGFDPCRHEPAYYHSLGVVLEHDGFQGNLTVRENLEFFARAKGLGAVDLWEYFSANWASSSLARDQRRVKYFSRGMKMQCALCRAFMGNPRVCFLDEPVVALDLEAYDHFCGIVRKLQSWGATILISSHQLDTIEDLCTGVGLLENGRISLVPIGDGSARTEEWIIEMSGDDTAESLIREVTGSPARQDGDLWHVTVTREAKSVIPELIARLVASGCSIFEVRRYNRTLKDSIRVHCRNR